MNGWIYIGRFIFRTRTADELLYATLKSFDGLFDFRQLKK